MEDGRHRRWHAAAGTRRVADFFPGASGSRPSNLTPFGKRLLFVADDGRIGRELWVTDGTAGGTKLVSDLRKGPASSRPWRFTVVGKTAFFVADDGVHGVELWRTDGTAAGTALVADVAPGPASAQPLGLPGPALRVADCVTHLRPETVAVLWTFRPSSGDWSVRGPLPPDPRLAGLGLLVQGLFAPGAPPLRFELTNGVRLTLGW